MEDEHPWRQTRLMKTVILVGEGQTEENFVKQVLAPSLILQDVYVEPRLIRTSRTSRGGALNWQRVLRFLRNSLRERGDTYVTTLFDLYKIPSDFPGVTESSDNTDPIARTGKIESAFGKAVVEYVGCRSERFLPHVQPYEFEGLLFSDPSKFEAVESKWGAFTAKLQSIRDSAASPEHINDDAHTHPYARLKVLKPRYRKVRDGTLVSKAIGIDRIRNECSHFNQWLTALEAL